MSRINRWKLADELTVYQISLLLAGHDPSEFDDQDPSDWPSEVKIDTSAFVAALKHASKSSNVTFREERIDGYGEYIINWNTSTIEIESLRSWLYVRNYDDGFFIVKKDEKETLLDEAGEFYAPKLAAAVRAWNEITSDPRALAGKSPKKALEIWLRA